MQWITQYFQFDAHKTSLKQEWVGGLTTFLSLSYIIFVNPSILSETGMDKSALIAVTCLSAIFANIVMGFWANAPLALAPGMGLNAFFTYSLVMGKNIPWQTALGIVFLSGLFFLVLSFSGIREKIFNAIPHLLKESSVVGIGLFIAFVGMKNMGLVESHPATIIHWAGFHTENILGLLGLLLMLIFQHFRIMGGIFWSIVLVSILSIFLGKTELPDTFFSYPASISPIFGQLDILSAFRLSFFGAIFSFFFVDMFDSMATIIACAKEAHLQNEQGKIKHFNRILKTDVLATLVGAVLGTSSTTIYSESLSGIQAGARTGLSSIFVALLFGASLFFTPVISIVPTYATAPALVLIGVQMFKNVHNLHLNDYKNSVPAFLTILFMPLTYSISMGMSIGFVSYVAIRLFQRQTQDLSMVLYVIAALCLLNLVLG